ncbi:hypothetical protein G6F56_002646 [Rhizopus delemar]|nr:hypothetical protein G6F56_002646 [Rhizopus delemar]
MIQFYLYYFANIPTWMKASSSEPLAPNCSNKTLGLNTTFGLKKTPKPISTPIVLQPQLTATIYTDVLEQYLVRLVPIHGNMSSSPVGRFYLDALVELWIRTPWIPSNGKLDPTLMFYISHFMKYIVRNDLKNCVERSTAYEAIRDEFYMLVSRLALNWEKTDGYIQFFELWGVWGSGWRRWTPFIMDNIPYYFSLVEIFLERTSQFSYVDDTTSLAGQLRSLYRIMNLFKAQDVLQVLALIERSLDIPSIDTIYTQQLAQLAGTSERYISTKIQKSSSRLAELEGRYPWRSKGLYTLDQRRSPCLIGSLAKLFDAINLPEPNIRSVPRPPRHVEQLEEAYGLFVNLFQLHDHQPYRALNGSAPAIGLFEIEYAGLKNGGFLTPEELEKIKQGKLTCSSRSIPALGIRAQTVVRSYENATLVLWSIRIDKYINETVS